MVLYSDPVKPLDHCARIVLAEKDINVEINYIKTGERTVELAELNPYSSVLTLIDRELVLYDAQIIMEYLDERFPHPPLMPVDPVSRASNRQLRYRVMRDLYNLIDSFTGDNDIAIANARKSLKDHLTSIAPVFAQKPFFMSDDYSLVDCCMAPVLWRLDEYGIKLPGATKPLQEYAERLFEREAFQNSMSEAECEIGEQSR
jgi:RNA polymerase-associated protein